MIFDMEHDTCESIISKSTQRRNIADGGFFKRDAACVMHSL